VVYDWLRMPDGVITRSRARICSPMGLRSRTASSESRCPTVSKLRWANSHLLPGVMTIARMWESNCWISAQTLTSRTFPGSGDGDWLFAIPIQGVSGDAGGTTFGRPAGMPHTRSEESQGSRTRGARIRAGCVRTPSTKIETLCLVEWNSGRTARDPLEHTFGPCFAPFCCVHDTFQA